VTLVRLYLLAGVRKPHGSSKFYSGLTIMTSSNIENQRQNVKLKWQMSMVTRSLQ